MLKALSSRARIQVVVIVAGIAVSFFSWFGMRADNFSPWSPLPGITVSVSLFGSMAIGGNGAGYWFLRYALPVLIGPGLFFVWNVHLLRGDLEVPRRSSLGLAILTVLSVFALWSGWGFGIKYQGRAHTVEVILLNGVALSICWGLWMLARVRPSLARSLLFHWATTVWLVWLAFPWQGEFP
jgi:hypothetical protein